MTSDNTTAAAGDGKALANDIQSLADAAPAPVADKVRELHDKGIDAMDKGIDAMDKAAEKYEDLQASASKIKNQALASTDAFVQENPWRATIVAATVGLLAGFIIARR